MIEKAIYFKKHSRVHSSGVSTVIAMCDADLIGKRLVGKKPVGKSGVLDLAAYAGFYKGELISSEKAGEILARFFASRESGFSFNLVGKQCIKTASKFIDVSRAEKLGTVPLLQVYNV